MIEDLHEVGGGVVLGGDEPGVGRNRDASLDQTRTHLGVVEDGGGDAGAGPARRATAGTAVERRGVRVVDGVAAVAAEHDHGSELGHADRGDDRFGEQRPLVERQTGVQIGAGGGVDDGCGAWRCTERLPPRALRHAVG